jgi:hypothetical protein
MFLEVTCGLAIIEAILETLTGIGEDWAPCPKHSNRTRTVTISS